jgi:hypothetical protein
MTGPTHTQYWVGPAPPPPRIDATVADETTDMSRMQQLSICLRWIDDEFCVHEDYVGMHEVEKADAASLTAILLDVIVRLGLDVKNLRGQGYDGASVMAGHSTGVAKRITDVESRATFVHCNAHCMSLAVQETARQVPLLRDTIEFVKDVVNFIRGSPLRMRVFEAMKEDMPCQSNTTSLRPLCPTRWVVRVKSIKSVLDNYEPLLQALQQVGLTSDETGAKASGFVKQLQSFDRFFALHVSLAVLEPAESCNCKLQSIKTSVADAKFAATKAADLIKSMRRDEYYDKLYSDCEQKTQTLDLDPPTLPRPRKTPRRYDDGADSVVFESPKLMYRQRYLQIIDHSESAIRCRFQQPGIDLACSIERILTHASKSWS